MTRAGSLLQCKMAYRWGCVRDLGSAICASQLGAFAFWGLYALYACTFKAFAVLPWYSVRVHRKRRGVLRCLEFLKRWLATTQEL